jgi:hypothetical protein
MSKAAWRSIVARIGFRWAGRRAPGAAPPRLARGGAGAALCHPVLPVGQRAFAAEVSWDLPNLAPGATSLLDVTVTGCRQGDLADAALASSTRFIELDAAAWTTNTVRVMARNISPSATFDVSPATLLVQVTKRRIP